MLIPVIFLTSQAWLQQKYWSLTLCGGHKSFEPIKEKIKLTQTLI